MTSTRTVAVIGLGNLGGAVAARLVARGLAVTGFDVAPDARERAGAAGVDVRTTIEDAVATAGVVVTSLPAGEHVRAAWTGVGGIVDSARRGTVLVELSTIDPQTMVDVARVAHDAGHDVVDCPVSGGPVEAAAGTLNLICAGDPDVVGSVAAVLDHLGTRLEAGAIGNAKTIKLVNNLMTNATVLVSAEAFQVGVAAGVPPDELFAVLSRLGGGRTPHFHKRFPWALDDDWRARFSIRLAEKDFRLGLDLARSAGVPTPAAATAHQLFAACVAEGFGDDDLVAVLRLYQHWSGRAVAPPGGRPTDAPVPPTSRGAQP